MSQTFCNIERHATKISLLSPHIHHITSTSNVQNSFEHSSDVQQNLPRPAGSECPRSGGALSNRQQMIFMTQLTLDSAFQKGNCSWGVEALAQVREIPRWKVRLMMYPLLGRSCPVEDCFPCIESLFEVADDECGIFEE
jgi:hypothetical protein